MNVRRLLVGSFLVLLISFSVLFFTQAYPSVSIEQATFISEQAITIPAYTNE